MRFPKESNGGRPASNSHTSLAKASHENPLFVYIKMPGDIDPEDRWSKFADPLQQALEKDDLGEVTGGEHNFQSPMKMEKTLLNSAESMLTFMTR